MSAVAGPIAPQSAHKRHVNDLIHESLKQHLRSEPIAFFCECTSPHCFETVWLTAPQYDAGRLEPRWGVFAPGHRRNAEA
jgi:hypothetical protein